MKGGANRPAPCSFQSATPTAQKNRVERLKTADENREWRAIRADFFTPPPRYHQFQDFQYQYCKIAEVTNLCACKG